MKIPYQFEGRTLSVPSKGVMYSPTVDQNGNLTADVGLVVVGRNPVRASSRVILLAGCRTFACLGAARMLVLPLVNDFSRQIKKAENYCAVVRVLVEGSFVGHVEVLDWQPLAVG
jgi:hypothetical protein